MIFRHSFPLAFSAILLPALLSSCQGHKPDIDTFGQLDSAAIAADTTMQVNMDRSYEYLRTFAEGDTVAYDLLAYDKPQNSSGLEWESKFIIIRRAKGVQDTIAKEPRQGKVRSAWLSDLDHNGRSEFFFYTRPDQDTSKKQESVLYAFEANGRAKASRLSLDRHRETEAALQEDSFFIDRDVLVRVLTRSNAGYNTSDAAWQTYKLVNGKLVYQGQKIPAL